MGSLLSPSWNSINWMGLRAELAGLTKILESWDTDNRQGIIDTLNMRKSDPAYARIRGSAELAKLNRSRTCRMASILVRRRCAVEEGGSEKEMMVSEIIYRKNNVWSWQVQPSGHPSGPIQSRSVGTDLTSRGRTNREKPVQCK
jgi:hypothetical protein